MKRKAKVISFVVIVLLILSFLFRYQIEDGLACLAYYDQCTAERIEGLTNKECFEIDGAVAFLIHDKICLVQQNK